MVLPDSWWVERLLGITLIFIGLAIYLSVVIVLHVRGLESGGSRLTQIGIILLASAPFTLRGLLIREYSYEPPRGRPMDATDTASIIAAGGGGAILLELTKRGLGALSGAGRKRRDEVDRAWRRTDKEAQRRRLIEEHASRLRRILIGAPCVDATDIPPWPAYSSTDTNTSKESP